MRTPEEMATAVVDCWINDSEGKYVNGDPAQAAAALLTDWKDEAWQLGYDLGWKHCSDQKGWDKVEANL